MSVRLHKPSMGAYYSPAMSGDFFIVKGLGGKRTLAGELPVRGAKNAALPAFAASLLFKEPILFSNVPHIADVSAMGEIIEALGGTVERERADAVRVDARTVNATRLPRDLAKKMRASVILAGPLLARDGLAAFPHPGGCVIGARPIDLFLEAFGKMGARVETNKDDYVLRAPKGGLRGANIFFRQPTVTGTETILLAATRARGTTLLRNAAMEPEVVFLADLLRRGGADIRGAGTPTLEVRGSAALLSLPQKPVHIISDRIEAGSFLILAALLGKDISITRCAPEHIRVVIELLRTAGVNIVETKNTIRVRAPVSAAPYRSFSFKTHEYPGFPTDLQAPCAVFLTQAVGEALIHEAIFEGRLAYAGDLVAMGADITLWDAHRATVRGPRTLKGRKLHGPDLRAGLAYLIAALTAHGSSVVGNAALIDRGYERIEERLSAVGATIERVSN